MNSQSIFSQIKDHVTTRDAAEFYGYQVDRKGMMCCPFHGDKNPSMKVDERFICFACGEKGDVINFVSLLFGLKPYDAALKLNSDMCLGIKTDSRKGAEAPEIDASWIKRRNSKLAAYHLERESDHIYKVYSDYFRIISKLLLDIGPICANDELVPAVIAMAQLRDYLENALDTLLCGSYEDKAQIVIKSRKEVKDLERQIREYEAGDRGCTLGDCCSD